MTDLDQTPFSSPLCQPLTREGRTVQIEIYDDGAGGWLLEVVDEYGNSTVWDDSFKTDRDALNEVFDTVDTEGIDSLIGLPFEPQEAMDKMQPMSAADLDELDAFLASASLEETSMDVATLDGFLTAIAIGPNLVLPSEWLPWIWDMDEGEAEPAFVDAEQAGRMLSLVLRHYNAVVQTFNAYPASFEPLFWRRNHQGASAWCAGFLQGFMFNEQAWSRLSGSHPAWFVPFMGLCIDDGLNFENSAAGAEKWMSEIKPAIVKIHAYWKEHSAAPMGGVTLVRNAPKIGRNDLCPCGSGKKFKKCCGSGDHSPVIALPR